MFEKGEYVMYSCHGCCIIADYSEVEMDGAMKMYYHLTPIGENRTVIMTPVDNQKVRIRKIISGEEGKKIFGAIQELEDLEWIDNRTQRSQNFKNVIREGSTQELAQLVKTLLWKKMESRLEKQKFTVADTNVLRDAEKLLYSELSASIQMDLGQIKEQINKKLQEKFETLGV
ncbi:CarD family transcriptional regulator [Clostridia bacterium]|nr:CarD family transcriptional regulator [Clostridia bacterium]